MDVWMSVRMDVWSIGDGVWMMDMVSLLCSFVDKVLGDGLGMSG